MEVSKKIRNKLYAYDWPGNVRELGNALERAAILSPDKSLSESDLVLGTGPSKQAPVLDGTLKSIEREAIKQALLETDGHRKNTADKLGIGLRTLYDKLKEYNLG